MADTLVRTERPAASAEARRGAVAAPHRKGRFVPLLYVAPALVFYALFVIAPWLHSFWISFWNWNGIGAATWAGLSNYTAVFEEPALRAALTHAFGFIVFYTVVPVILGLILAAVTSAVPWRAMPVIRTIIFLPQILPLVAVGVVWKWIYGEDGPLNQMLRAVGLGSLARAWLGDFTYAFPAVGLIGTWVSTGLCFLLLLAGIGKIEPSLYEAARLDGCGRLREFWHITVPGLRKEIGVACNVTVISALAGFDVVYVMTGGGPGYSTMVPGVQVYQLVFTAGRVGTACALATVLSLITCAAMYGLNRLSRER
ncbi:carbohydrate ABC transporter membrane protein 1, CUT1 family [Streptomyces sp. 2131.1]|uniref:carbohydrate ABC transporter permease n=1 Tax=Streptomyces sp. 2131.1 TaxID=1855346 RepID=UPI00089CF56A|nr:sugar ABC transporter permease [Streptomyces sp. 2131.1]SEE51832.1 carbohydrate ABC transporter membrane protein 1, CUT1 family [Streptomyces sp. 2131.1]